MVNSDYIMFFIEIFLKDSNLEGSLYDIFPRFRGYQVRMLTNKDSKQLYVGLLIKTRLGGELEREYLSEQDQLLKNKNFMGIIENRFDNTYISLTYDISGFVPAVIQDQLLAEMKEDGAYE